MQARQLEVFCMLMRCGTVTGAAGMLNISQPALSQILLHAEDQLGFKLFDRVRGRLVPTQEANELYPEAERIFSELGALRRRTVDMRHGRTGLVRLAASAPPSMSIVPKALTAFREAHPDIVVRSLVAPIANIRDMLRSGDVLLGVAMNDVPHSDLDVETVGHAELVCLMPEGHRLAGQAELGFADLAEETLISYRVDTLPGRLLAGALEAEGGVYAPAVEIDLSITALPFVREGIGVAVVDGLLPWSQFSGIVQRPFRPSIQVPIAILTSKERPPIRAPWLDGVTPKSETRAMPAPLQTIPSSPSLPERADAVVIGGGIVGVWAAYFLARRGLSVALVEKGQVGAEQSSRNWGWCRQQNRDARELPMATKSLDLWERFAAESGEDTGFSRCGLLYLSNDDGELAGWARWRDFARTVGVTTHMLSAAEAAERGRATGKPWKGGVFSPSDGIADPARAAPAVAKAIMKLGGTVHQGCAARGLETAGGRVCGVVTEKGTIRTALAVLAGGAWASSFCHQMGVRFPLASIRSSILSVGPSPSGLPDALHTAAVSITRRGDGGHTLAISGRGRVDPTLQQIRFAPQFMPMFARRWRSLMPGGTEGMRSGHETLRRWRLDRPTPMERVRVLDPSPDRGTIRLTHERATALLPGLKDAPITAAWAGYIDSTPDGVPAIGEVGSLPGLILAAGFSGHGFGIGPGAGHLIADLITDQPPIVDPKPYHPDRFAGFSTGKVADF